MILVLRHVLRGDDEQRFLVGKGIAEEASGTQAAGILGQAAGPGRNGASGITGHFRSQRGEAGAQLGRLFAANGGMSGLADKGEGQRKQARQCDCIDHL
ncbi:hypothetical protein D3C80_1957710 [compost metagenome]